LPVICRGLQELRKEISRNRSAWVAKGSLRLDFEFEDLTMGAGNVKPATAPKLDHFRPVNLYELLLKPAPKRRWLIPDIIPGGEGTLIAGDGGGGKSLLMLQLAVAYATGMPWLGMPVGKQGKVLILSAEDDIDEMHYRFECIVRSLPDDETKRLALKNVWLLDASKDLDPTLAHFDDGAKELVRTDTFGKLKAFVAHNQIDLLILDSAADVFSEEINRYAVRSFVRLIRGLADTVILLGHPSVSGLKDGRGYSGSTHWSNAFRSRLKLERDDKDKQTRARR
jgi:RecA-family ATPase